MTTSSAARGVSAELREIVRLATPISLAQFGLMLLGLVDVAILGHASADELGGGGIGRSIGFVAVALNIGAMAALEPLASQAVGANEPHVAHRAYRASLVACVLLWAPCALLAVLSTYLLEPLGIGRSLVGPARAFVVGHVPGMLAFPVFLSAKTYLQAHNRTTAAVVAAVVANALNVVVCNVLVRGDDALAIVGIGPRGLPRLGALGAGIASSISATVLAGFVVVAAARMAPHEPEAVPTRSVGVRDVLRVGMPIGLHMLAEIGVFSLVAVIAGRLGAVAVSAHQIAIGLASFTFMGVLGVSSATAVRVGVAVGEGRPPRLIGLVGLGVVTAFMASTGALFLLAPGPLVRLFTDDPAIREVGMQLLAIAAAFQLFDGLQGVAAGALRGAGDVRFAFAANVVGHWAVGLPLALYLGFARGWGAKGLWWGLALGLAIVATALVLRFVRLARGVIARI